jgi:hypothetical protein
MTLAVSDLIAVPSSFLSKKKRRVVEYRLGFNKILVEHIPLVANNRSQSGTQPLF